MSSHRDQIAGDVDVAVIGKGMIGSAAARHLAEAGVRVALIGHDEPDNITDSTAPLASHYDQARITRRGADEPTWAALAAASIDRYHDIERRSGVAFHQPTGLVHASRSALPNARGVSRGWVMDSFGIGLSEHACEHLSFEGPPAGLIRPRRLIAAQVALAVAAGAHVISEPASEIQATGSQLMATTANTSVTAHQVIVATGAYASSLSPVALPIERRLRTVVHVELDGVRDLPCLIVARPQSSDLDRLYWTSPVRHPDGRQMLKVGASVMPLQVAESDADIGRWFANNGSATEAAHLLGIVQRLLPNSRVISWQAKPCVMSYTPTELPLVGRLANGVVVASGGNGSAAKSSDEIGRLAAATASADLPVGPKLAVDVDMSLFAPLV